MYIMEFHKVGFFLFDIKIISCRLYVDAYIRKLILNNSTSVRLIDNEDYVYGKESTVILSKNRKKAIWNVKIRQTKIIKNNEKECFPLYQTCKTTVV